MAKFGKICQPSCVFRTFVVIYFAQLLVNQAAGASMISQRNLNVVSKYNFHIKTCYYSLFDYFFQ